MAQRSRTVTALGIASTVICVSLGLLSLTSSGWAWFALGYAAAACCGALVAGVGHRLPVAPLFLAFLVPVAVMAARFVDGPVFAAIFGSVLVPVNLAGLVVVLVSVASRRGTRAAVRR